MRNSGFEYSQENIDITAERPATPPNVPRLTASCYQGCFVKLHNLVRIINAELNWFCSHTSLRALPRVSRAISPQARLLWSTIFTILLSSAIVCLYFLITSFIQFKTSFETQEAKRVSPFPSLTVCPHRPLSKIGEELVERRTPSWFAKQYTNWVATNGQRIRPIPLSYPGYSQYFQLFQVYDLPIYTPAEEDFIVECRINTGSSLGLTSIAMWSKCSTSMRRTQRIVDSKHFFCYTITVNNTFINTANGFSITLFLENYVNVTEGKSAESLLECRQCMSDLPETWRQGARVVVHQPATRPDMSKGIDLSPGSINEITFDTVFTNYMSSPYGDCTVDALSLPIEANNITYNYTVDACEKQQLQNFIRQRCGCLDPTLPMRLTDYKKPVYCEYWPWENIVNDPNVESRVLNNSKCLIDTKLIYDQQKYNKCQKPCIRITNSVKTSSTIGFRRSMLHHLYTKLKASGRISGPIASIQKFEDLIAANRTQEAAAALMLARDFHDSFIVLDVKRQDFSPKVITQREDFKLYNLLSMIGGVCSLFLGFSIFVFFELGEVLFYIVRGLLFADSRPRAAEIRRKSKRQHNEPPRLSKYVMKSAKSKNTKNSGASVVASTADVLAKYDPYPLNMTNFTLTQDNVSIPTVSLKTFVSSDAVKDLEKQYHNQYCNDENFI